jgi:hypothetical protein
MLLDDLLANRQHVEMPTSEAAALAPVLTIEPVAVPPAGELGRRAARQRLAALEEAARRNLRAAEEARRVLADEHRRLEEESCARLVAQDEAAALRRELGRLRESEQSRADQLKTYAARAARAEMAVEHDRVVEELYRLQGSIRDHDGLLEDYAQWLREEQETRAALRAELEEAEAARRLAERGLERAVESARQQAEDEVIRLASAEAALADARSDRDRLEDQLEALLEEMRANDATARVADLEAELVQARADGDRLRAHAAALGDELAAVRATLAEVRAAVPPPGADLPATETLPTESTPVARPPLARRRPRAERDAAKETGVRREGIVRRAAEPDAGAGVPVPVGFRRRAMAELTALASASEADDFTFRHP